MRGLSHTRPATGDEPASTILAMFHQEGGGPDQLSAFDIGYLRSLYYWDPNVSAATRLLGVRRRAEETREESAEP